MKKIQLAVLVFLAMSMAGYAGQDHKVLKVNVLRADIRGTADVTGKVIFQVKLGDMLEYKAKVGNWYELLGDDGLVVGYINAFVVDEVVVKIPEITEQEKYMTAAKQILTIATTLADYVTDNASFPVLEKSEDCLLKKESAIYKLLVPKYAKNLPLIDPWGKPYEIYLGSCAGWKICLTDFGIQETTVDDFLVASQGKLGAHEIWKYDPKSPEAGLYPEFDQTKNIINFNGAFIRGKKIENSGASTIAAGSTPPDSEPPIRALGEIKPPELIKQVDPVYPEVAQQARVEGVVIIEATTDSAGKVVNAQVLRSIPLLDEAALAAVKQWIYEPYIINGRKRGVIFTVTVSFTLKF